MAALLYDGATQPAIAARMNLSVNTIKSYVKEIYSKLHGHRKILCLTAVKLILQISRGNPRSGDTSFHYGTSIWGARIRYALDELGAVVHS